MQESDVASMKVEFATLETEFDSDLYLLDGISCPNYVCSGVYTNTTCICNYEIGPNCGTAPPGCPPCPIDDRCSVIDRLYNPIRTLTDGVPDRSRVGNAYTIHYRYELQFNLPFTNYQICN